MMEHIQDSIVSGNNNAVIAYVDVVRDNKQEESYSGKIIENKFPSNLIFLFNEFHELANSMTFTLIDEIVDDIDKYELTLKKNKIRIYDLVIKENSISFLIKNPRR